MAERIVLVPIDWELYSELRRLHHLGGSAASLAAAFASLKYSPPGGGAAAVAQAAAVHDYAVAGPLALRLDPADESSRFADWLVAAPIPDAGYALTAAAAAASATRLFGPDYLMLAYFSPRYRPIALGIPGAEGVLDLYDGPPVLARAMASGLGGEPGRTVLHAPEEVKEIAADLLAVSMTAGGRGEMRLLLDSYEDSFPGELAFDERIESDLLSLRAEYGAAAAAGRAMRVVNG